jgi:hypothetical protein
MKYYDGFGKDVSDYVYELERKAALFDAQNKGLVEPNIVVVPVEPKIDVPLERTTRKRNVTVIEGET